MPTGLPITSATNARLAAGTTSSPHRVIVWFKGWVISPPLDDAGNSVRAQRAIAGIVNALNANPYAAR